MESHQTSRVTIGKVANFNNKSRKDNEATDRLSLASIPIKYQNLLLLPNYHTLYIGLNSTRIYWSSAARNKRMSKGLYKTSSHPGVRIGMIDTFGKHKVNITRPQ